MIKKKGKFLTFIFSLLPGAGHMYLGFMKLGTFLLSTFFAIIFLGVWLDLSPVMFFLPVVWFYSFFDALNKNSLRDDEFYQLKDEIPFNVNSYMDSYKSFTITKEFRFIMAIILIVLGINLFAKNLLNIFDGIIPSYLYNAFYRFYHVGPQLLIAAIIVYAGVKMIIGKKNELVKELEDHENA